MNEIYIATNHSTFYRGIASWLAVLLLWNFLFYLFPPIAMAGSNGTKNAWPAMHFEIVRSADRACEPVCPQWIAATGKIMADSPKKLRRVLHSLGKQGLPVILDSGGGDVDAAMSMGRLIRSRGLSTGVASTIVENCADSPSCKGSVSYGSVNPQSSHCESACIFMLAGGLVRLVGPDATVGVHAIMTGRAETGLKPIDKAYKVKLEHYLEEMNIAPSLINRMLETSSNNISVVSSADMAIFRLTTRTGTAKELVAKQTCEQAEEATNCIDLHKWESSSSK